MRTWSNMVPKLIPLQELWIWTLWTVCHSLILRMGKMIVCVCVCVCVSITAFYLKTMGPILIKLGPHDLPKKKLFLSEVILLMFFICFKQL